jgi:hypothetical protein
VLERRLEIADFEQRLHLFFVGERMSISSRIRFRNSLR